MTIKNIKPTSRTISQNRVPLVGVTTYQAHTVEKGDLVISLAAQVGYFKSYITADVPAVTTAFAGVSMERQTIGADDLANGLASVLVAQTGIVGFAAGSLTQADVGKNVFATDSDTLTLTATANLFVGSLQSVENGIAWVKIDDAAGKLSTLTA